MATVVRAVVVLPGILTVHCLAVLQEVHRQRKMSILQHVNEQSATKHMVVRHANLQRGVVNR